MGIWDAKEDKDSLYLRIDIFRLRKEDVKVSEKEENKGEGKKESENEESRRFSTRIDMPLKL